MVYSKGRPAKRKRATLESDPPRDTRTGWRRRSVRQGSLRTPLPTTQPFQDSQSFPPMPCKLRGPLARISRVQADIFPEQLADIIAEQ